MDINLSKVFIGLLIGLLLFYCLKKLKLIEGIEIPHDKNSCYNDNPTTCNNLNLCKDNNENPPVCNPVGMGKYNSGNISGRGGAVATCEAESGFQWCGPQGPSPSPPPSPSPLPSPSPSPSPLPSPSPSPPPFPSPSPSPAPLPNSCGPQSGCPYKTKDGTEYRCLKYQPDGSYVCTPDQGQRCTGDGMSKYCDGELLSRQIPQDKNFSKRKINIKNNCDRPIKIISTIPQGVLGNWLNNKNDPACDENAYGYGTLSSTLGKKKSEYKYGHFNELSGNYEYGNMEGAYTCGDPFTYRSDSIDAGSEFSWFEDLYKANQTIGGKIGCTEGTFCRPSTNYQAIWADEPRGVKNSKTEEFMKMQGKAEFTFGADDNVDDNFDVSAMLIGGCGAHINPWENDLGFTDLTTNNQPCGDGFDYHKNNQTMHKKSNIANVLQGNTNVGDYNHIYNNYDYIIKKLQDDKSWITSQGAGCFSSTGKVQDDQNCIINETIASSSASDSYVCGFPLYYRYNGTIYLFIDEDSKRRFYPIKDIDDAIDSINIAIKNEPSNNDIIRDGSKLYEKIITAMRNDLYKCTSSQSRAQTDYHNLKDKGDKLMYLFPNYPGNMWTDFIPFEINANDANKCNLGPGKSVLRENDTCNIEGSPLHDNLQPVANTCPSGYMFNFDDMVAGQQCNLEDSTIHISPEYDIVYCPKNKPSPQGM